MKLLIITPEIHRLGGVANHYLGLDPHWTFDIEYFFYGKRKDSTPTWKTMMLYPYDFVRCLTRIVVGKIDVVVVNPSLRRSQLLRDGLFLLLARACGKPVVTFIHGVDVSLAASYVRGGRLFRWCFNKSLFIYTLYSGFRKMLIEAGIRCPIELTTTKVANELLDGCTIEPRRNVSTLLFVARMNREKGIFETIDAFSIVKVRHPDMKLIVCGDGPALNDAKRYAATMGLTDIEFRGNITGESLRKAYLEGDVYILPTRGEGMATTVLEAMAFGLPVLTSPVGGVNDFFTSDMGFLLEWRNPQTYAEAVESLMHNGNRIKDISSFNIKYAQEHFMADSVTRKYESDILKYIRW